LGYRCASGDSQPQLDGLSVFTFASRQLNVGEYPDGYRIELIEL
jgi:hypothetical protein